MLDLDELRKVAQVIYLIADEAVADDISGKIKAAVKEIEDLREFASWLMGCRCAFTQIKSFCDERDRLLKEETNGSRKN